MKEAKPKAKRTPVADRRTNRNHHPHVSPIRFTDGFTDNGLTEDSTPKSFTEEPTSIEAQWLPIIYRESFEAIFGSWMGKYSCPFTFVAGENAVGEVSVSISDLCHRLDRWMEEEESNATESPKADALASDRDHRISQSLQSTIAAFSARWLPITSPMLPLPEAQIDTLDLVQKLWRYARRNMLKVINLPTYRSMLTLFLFALTPIPTGISEEEEVDGISGQACLQVALQQIQILRARQKNLQFNGAKVSPSARPRAVSISPNTVGTSGFINAESIAYWAALTFDTSASLTLNCKSLLSSGLFGLEAEAPWRLVRTCGKMFSEVTEHWQPGSLAMSDERANQIIAAGAAWKLLVWKLTAVFKEALREGHDESEVSRAYTAVVDAIQQFNSTYRHHMEACQRRMQFLNQQTKLRWCEYCLSKR